MGERFQFYDTHLARVEKLAKRLISRRWKSPREVWKFQTDLIDYQLEIRSSITNERAKKKEFSSKISGVAKMKRGDWKSAIKKLQAKVKEIDSRIVALDQMLTLAKLIGDALAYLFLKGNEKKLRPLSLNSKNDLPTNEISLKAVLAVATEMYKGGAGFPLIHDATNCLRVGDITFCDITNDDDEPLTIEVKSKAKSIQNNIANLAVSLYADAPQQKFISTLEKLQEINKSAEDVEKDTTSEGSQTKEFEKRLKRQAKRMATARKLQNVKHGEMTSKKDDATPSFAVGLMVSHDDFHWDIVRKVLKKAKKTGFAAEQVDGAFLYYAIHTSKPLIQYPLGKGIPHADKFGSAIKNLLPHRTDGKGDNIYFMQSVDYALGDVPAFIRPYLWYNVPQRTRLDILCGRLLVGVIVNMDKIVEALEKGGISVDHSLTDTFCKAYAIPVKIEFRDASNKILYQGQMAVPREMMAHIGYEFLALHAFVGQVKQIIQGSTEIVKAHRKSLKNKPGVLRGPKS